MTHLRYLFNSIYKRIENNLQREEAVAGEVVVSLACHPRPGEKLELLLVAGKVELVERFLLGLVGVATKFVFSELIMKK